MKSWQLQFDRHYGIDRRTGYTVIYDQCVIVQLEPWLVVALAKAVIRLRRWK